MIIIIIIIVTFYYNYSKYIGRYSTLVFQSNLSVKIIGTVRCTLQIVIAINYLSIHQIYIYLFFSNHLSYPSIYRPSIYLPNSKHIYRSIHQSYLSIYLSNHPSIFQSIHPSIYHMYPSIYPCIHPFIHTNIHTYLHTHMYVFKYTSTMIYKSIIMI